MRVVALVLVALMASGCLPRMGGQEPAGPEQFVFTARPGTGTGEEASSLVEGMGTVQEADHVATVPTPLGEIDYVIFAGDDGVACESVIGEDFEGFTCGIPPEEIPPEELRILGTGQFDDWVVVELRAGEAVASVVATSDDGQTYRATLEGGFGAIVHPLERGQLEVQGLDVSGAPVGDTILSDSFTQGAPVPEPTG